MIDARASRNGEDASDLVTALLSNVGALHNQAWLLSGDVSRLMEKSMPRTAPPIVFIAKLKPCTPAFGFFGRKTGYIVADRMGRLAETVISLLSNRIDAVFQAVIIRPWEGHGPSRSCPFRFEQTAH
jgi:hypothetical protein